MASSPLRTAATVLAERATTDKPVKVGSAATPDTALAGAGAVTPSTAPSPCNPKQTDVTKLQAVLDARGFTEGATLMRKWLSLPAAINPHFAAIDMSTITMDFVLRF